METWKIQNDPAHVRNLLWERDRGICAACGRDAEVEFDRWRRAVKAASGLLDWLESREKLQASRDHPGCVLHSPEILAALWPDAVRRGRWDRDLYWVLREIEQERLTGQRDPGWTRGRSSGWDADHIHEVVRGGGQCSLENYQTLCHPCHKAKTRRLMGELAAQRKSTREALVA